MITKRKEDKPEIQNSANHRTVGEGDIELSRDAWSFKVPSSTSSFSLVGKWVLVVLL